MTRAKTNQRQIVINRNRSRRFRYSRKNSKAQEEGEDDVFNMSFHENRGSKSVLELLRAWVNCYAIPVRAVNTLLKILIIAGLHQLPKDYRSLLKTPRSLQISPVAGGEFWYNGIAKNLKLLFPRLDHDLIIELNFNMDGLPIFKSSQRCFWPILSTIHKMPHIQPMIIAIWCGYKKPSNLNEYLEEFITELKDLLSNGLTINGHFVKIIFRCCICDTPARAFLKGTVNFNHTFGCQQCMTRGEFSKVGRCMTFPRADAQLRTDINFRDRSQPTHHKERSIFENLSIDMVRCFPTSDPLHLLDLGIMKRCLLRWTEGAKQYSGKWTKQKISEANVLLKQMNNSKPMEIHRAVRGLTDLKYWKGTEFRSFLLYFGLIILKEQISSDEYNHFLLLTCAVRIYYVDVYSKYRDIAKKWLNTYFEGCIDLFGTLSIGSNVHNLIHIHEDVIQFGCLNDLSTYPFENRLHFLKMRLKQPNLPLQQIARRIVELSDDYDTLFGTQYVCENKQSYSMSFPYKFDNDTVFKEIFIKSNSNFTLSTRKDSDRWFLTEKNDIVRMNHALSRNNIALICGSSIKHKENFFSHPVSSMRLHIYKSDGELNDSTFFELHVIKAKIMFFPHDQGFVFMPLLHTLNSY